MSRISLLRNLCPALLATFALAMPALCHAEVGNWSYDSGANEITSAETKYAHLFSENKLDLPYPNKSDINQGMLMVRGGKSVDVQVSVAVGQILCPTDGDGCRVTAQFDQGPPIKFKARGPADYRPLDFFILDAKRFIGLAAKANEIRIQFPMRNAGNQTLVFSAPTPLVWDLAEKK